MNLKKSIYAIIFAASSVGLLANCSGSKKDEGSHDAMHHGDSSTTATPEAAGSSSQFVVDANFQKQLADVFSAYVKLKDAFVATDGEKVKQEATATETQLTKVDMKLLTGAAHNDWMTFLAPMQSSLKEIQSGSDIEAQRKSFSSLSDNLYKTVKAFGLGGKEAYYEFCPMAFNNEGAHWLSDAEQIRNPYFGDKMLTCGSVQEKLK